MAGTGQESLVPPDVVGGFSIKFATYQGKQFFRRTTLRVLFLFFIAPGPPSAPADAGKASGSDRRFIGTYAMGPRMDLSQALISRRRRRTDLAPMYAMDATARAREIYGIYGREVSSTAPACDQCLP